MDQQQPARARKRFQAGQLTEVLSTAVLVVDASFQGFVRVRHGFGNV